MKRKFLTVSEGGSASTAKTILAVDDQVAIVAAIRALARALSRGPRGEIQFKLFAKSKLSAEVGSGEAVPSRE